MGYMKLVVTIDAEEDNWNSYNPHHATVENISRLPSLQQVFDEFHVKPTYLIAYPVATNEKAVSVLLPILQAGKCEIGAHCHPWNTPPFTEENKLEHSLLCNLPGDLQYQKIKTLHETIRRSFGIVPVSFRSGRWGYGPDVAQSLNRLNYKIDSSVSSYMDWRGSYGPDFSNLSPNCFRFSYSDIFMESTQGHLLEVPATIGFLQRDNGWTDYLFNGRLRKLTDDPKAVRVLCKLRFLKKVWLCPEISDSRSMIRLARQMMRDGFALINLFFHSSSLQAGLTPHVRTKADEERFLRRIREFLAFTRSAGIESIKLSEAWDLWQ